MLRCDAAAWIDTENRLNASYAEEVTTVEKIEVTLSYSRITHAALLLFELKHGVIDDLVSLYAYRSVLNYRVAQTVTIFFVNLCSG